jgi:hypothetical protein
MLLANQGAARRFVSPDLDEKPAPVNVSEYREQGTADIGQNSIRRFTNASAFPLKNPA